MRAIRRSEDDVRIEMMPLIDVIFLLLTFFIYAMVLMVRAELLPMDLQRFESGIPATPAAAITINVMLDGSVHFNREPIALDDLLTRIEQAKAEDPAAVIYLAMADGEGSVDRGPLLTSIWDRLQNAGLEINLVGRPSD